MNLGAGVGWAVLICILVVGVVFQYQRYVVDRDFLLWVSAPCDAKVSSCFVAPCDADLACDSAPYAKVALRADEAPTCLEEHNCATFACRGNETCTITYCSPGELEAGETCVGRDVSATD